MTGLARALLTWLTGGSALAAVISISATVCAVVFGLFYRRYVILHASPVAPRSPARSAPGYVTADHPAIEPSLRAFATPYRGYAR
jgi:hypothetical protein